MCGSADSTERNGVPEHPRTVPFVISFILESRSFLWSEHIDGVEVLAFSGNKGSATEKIAIFDEIVTIGESVGVCNNFFSRVALKED